VAVNRLLCQSRSNMPVVVVHAALSSHFVMFLEVFFWGGGTSGHQQTFSRRKWPKFMSPSIIQSTAVTSLVRERKAKVLNAETVNLQLGNVSYLRVCTLVAYIYPSAETGQRGPFACRCYITRTVSRKDVTEEVRHATPVSKQAHK
jgi:hypothetical protein